MTIIQEKLFGLQDLVYRDFNSSLIPTLDKKLFIGVRTPALRELAKEMVKDGSADAFIKELPHQYFEENQLHAFILSLGKDYEETVDKTNEFLPYVDNWATCDQMSPKIFAKHKAQLLEQIDRWLDSGEVYTIRFGIEMLMSHYLDKDFDKSYLEKVSTIKSEEYYVNMMIAWYFATALAKQYEDALPYFVESRMERWVHNKAIQKARESRRISPEQKEYLKTLKK